MNNRLIFYLLGKKNGFDMKAWRNLVQDSQFWTPERIEAYQMKQLRLLLDHAYKHVPYYKEAFDHEGIKPSDIRCTADLCRIKPIRKKDVTAHPEAFLADNRAVFRGRKHVTGGTTGEVLAYWQDDKAWALNWALKLRTFEWAGFNYGRDRLGMMAGGSLTPQRHTSFSNHLWRKVNNCFSMPISHLDEATMEAYARQLKRQQIRFLRGYPSALSTFASFLCETGKTLPMRAVFSTAEVLYPHQRALMSQAFGCEVFDTYGCGDGMGHATECEFHDGLHVCHEASIMQIVDADGHWVASGEEGEIVLTSLYDYIMPLIRYAPGDYAKLKVGGCPCGRDGLMLEHIAGRVTDSFVLPNGRILNGLSIPLEDLSSAIGQFQIVQETLDRVTVKIVPRMTTKTDVVETILRVMRHHCGEGVNVEVNIVDRIEVPPSGKFRYIVSQVER